MQIKCVFLTKEKVKNNEKVIGENKRRKWNIYKRLIKNDSWSININLVGYKKRRVSLGILEKVMLVIFKVLNL